jgi:hypothetical protein
MRLLDHLGRLRRETRIAGREQIDTDLMAVLDGRSALDELLRRKKRYADETGKCYFPASRML